MLNIFVFNVLSIIATIANIVRSPIMTMNSVSKTIVFIGIIWLINLCCYYRIRNTMFPNSPIMNANRNAGVNGIPYLTSTLSIFFCL